MASFLSVSGEPGEQFTVADIIALADELRRRNIPRTEQVQVIATQNGRKVVTLHLHVPLRNFKIIPFVPRPKTSTPMRGARRGRR